MAARKQHKLATKTAQSWNISDIRYAFPPQARPRACDTIRPIFIPVLHELSKISEREIARVHIRLRKAVLKRLSASTAVEKVEVAVEDVQTVLNWFRKTKSRDKAETKRATTEQTSITHAAKGVPAQGVRRSARLNAQLQEQEGSVVMIPDPQEDLTRMGKRVRFQSQAGRSRADEDSDTEMDEEKEIPETPTMPRAVLQELDAGAKHAIMISPDSEAEYDGGEGLDSDVQVVDAEDHRIPTLFQLSPQRRRVLIPETPYLQQSPKLRTKSTEKSRTGARLDDLRASEDRHCRLAGEHLSKVAEHRKDARRRQAEIEKLEERVRYRYLAHR